MATDSTAPTLAHIWRENLNLKLVHKTTWDDFEIFHYNINTLGLGKAHSGDEEFGQYSTGTQYWQ